MAELTLREAKRLFQEGYGLAEHDEALCIASRIQIAARRRESLRKEIMDVSARFAKFKP